MLNSDEYNIAVDFFLNEFGFNFTPSQKKDLERVLIHAEAESNNIPKGSLIKKILNRELTKDEYNAIVKYLTIGETYFFREKKSLDILTDEILTRWLPIKEKIKIWSAACSSGEEPYSLAIFFKEKFAQQYDSKFEIWGSDINPEFIERAKKGEYREWSFRNCPPFIKKKYFVEVGKNLYRLDDEIKNAVNFQLVNLAAKTFPEPFNILDYFDIILLRNVLIYFSSETIKTLLERVFNILSPGGYLITGVTEIAFQNYSKFKPVKFKGIKIFQKDLNFNPYEKKRESANIYVSKKEKSRNELKHKKLSSFAYGKSISNRDERIVTKRKIEAASVPDKLSFPEIKKMFEAEEYEELLERTQPLLENLDKNKLADDNLRGILFLTCKTFSILGKIEQAIEICEKITAVFKLDENFFYFLAVLLNEEGKTSDALKNLDKALFLNHNFAMANFLRANLLFKLNKNDSAKKELKNTLNILQNMDDNLILEEADGLTVGSLKKIVENMADA
jgi:chemotaxis protein methyltransferase CheR